MQPLAERLARLFTRFELGRFPRFPFLEAERLRGEPVPADVLASSKRHLAGLFLMRLAALDRTASYLAAVVESGRDPAAVMGTYQERLAAVTPEAALAAICECER